jgi:hypothetical protein
VLIAEQEKYRPTPRRSPRRHSKTTWHDRIRYLDGAANRKLSNLELLKKRKVLQTGALRLPHHRHSEDILHPLILEELIEK